MKKAVFGLAATHEQACRIVDHLLSSGFQREDISVLCADQNKNRAMKTKLGDISEEAHTWERQGTLSTEKATKAPEGAATGATAGGILGGSLGLLAGIGSLAIPGLGPFIAAGPIMAALSGSAIGGSLGLLIGSLVGAGIPEYEAKRYEAGLKEGNILISVHTENDEEIKNAKEIMENEDLKDISSAYEKAA